MRPNRRYVAFNLYIPTAIYTSYTVVMDLFGEDVTVLPMGLKNESTEFGGLVAFGIDALKAYSSDELLVGLNLAGSTSRPAGMTEKGPALRLNWRAARDAHGGVPRAADWTHVVGHYPACGNEAHDVQYDDVSGASDLASGARANASDAVVWRGCENGCGCPHCSEEYEAGGGWGAVIKFRAGTGEVLGRWEVPGTSAVNHVQVFADDQARTPNAAPALSSRAPAPDRARRGALHTGARVFGVIRARLSAGSRNLRRRGAPPLGGPRPRRFC